MTSRPGGSPLYRFRVRAYGWVFAQVIARLNGHRRRARANLALARPDLSPDVRNHIESAAANNFGRCTAELIHFGQMMHVLRDIEVVGPGVAAMDAAMAEGRPLILATAHMGNYLACVAALSNQGYRAGIMFRTRGNGLRDWIFHRAMKRLGQVLFKIGHRRDKGHQQGLRRMVAHLRDGNAIGVVLDQRVPTGVRLKFLDRPALTSLSAAKLALKHGAVFLPACAERLPDGINFRIWLEAPIRHTGPRQMMQVFNNHVSRWITERPEQWFWNIRRFD